MANAIIFQVNLGYRRPELGKVACGIWNCQRQ